MKIDFRKASYAKYDVKISSRMMMKWTTSFKSLQRSGAFGIVIS